MLERLRAACLTWTLLCWLVPMSAWFGCESTETGNPPAALDAATLDAGAMSWLKRGADAEVIGKAGAVKPGGSEVEALVDGVVVGSTTSNSNGSFEMIAVGAGEGNFEIRAGKGRLQSDTLKASDIRQQDATSVSQDSLTEVDATSEVDAAAEVDTASADAGAGEAPPISTGPDAAAPAAPDAATPVLDAATAPMPDAASAVVADAQSISDAQSRSDASDAAVVASGATCSELHQQVETRIVQLRAETSIGCRTAQDCVLARFSTSCYQICDMAVLGTKTADVTAGLTQIEQQICAPHDAMSCAMGGFRCELMGGDLSCVDGECRSEGTPQVTGTGRT